MLAESLSIFVAAKYKVLVIMMTLRAGRPFFAWRFAASPFRVVLGGRGSPRLATPRHPSPPHHLATSPRQLAAASPCPASPHLMNSYIHRYIQRKREIEREKEREKKKERERGS